MLYITKNNMTLQYVISSYLPLISQVPLRNCIVPLLDDMDCGYNIQFSPLEDSNPLEHDLNRNIFFYKRDICSLSCSKTDGNETLSSFSNSNTFWLFFVNQVIGVIFLESSFAMMVRLLS